MEDYLLTVDLEKIVVNPSQPRQHFDQEALQELAQSIQAVGILHPPLVRKIGEGIFEMISGERRWRAAKLAGLEKISVVVTDAKEPKSAKAALIENVQREDLNPLEIAESMKNIIETYGMSQSELATRLGKKRSSVANFLRLLTLSGQIREKLRASLISMGHAKALLSLSSDQKRLLLLEKIEKENLSVRQAEALAIKFEKKWVFDSEKEPLPKDCHVTDLEDRLKHYFGTKVALRGNKKGQLVMDYVSTDDLQRLLELMGVTN